MHKYQKKHNLKFHLDKSINNKYKNKEQKKENKNFSLTMTLFNNMTMVKDNEGGRVFMNKEAHDELTAARHDSRLKGGLLEEQADFLHEQLEENKKLKEEIEKLKENSLPKDEIIEILGCDDDLDDEVILDWIRDGEKSRTTEYCKEDDLNEKIEKLKQENEGKKHRINELIQYKEMWKEENDKLKETLEKKDKQIALLVRNKKNREKQLIHIRAICENTDEYIEGKVCEKMDEYVVKKQNDKIDYLKHLLNEAEPFLSYAKDSATVCADDPTAVKLDDLLIEIENI